MGEKTTLAPVSMTHAEWCEKAVALFGIDPMEWRFVCPACGHVAKVADWKRVGAPSIAAGFSCIGRWMDKARDAFGTGPGPCNYAGGGLIGLNPWRVTLPDGVVIDVFSFDEPKEAARG